MSVLRKLGLFMILAGLFYTVPTASAHRPGGGEEDGVTVIPDPSTSFAYYRELRTPGQLDVYQVTAQRGQFFHAGINIPQLTGLENYGVTMALIGPGLPALDQARLTSRAPQASHLTDGHDHANDPTGEHLDLPVGLDQANLGGVVADSLMSADFYEPFTQTSYWGRQTLELELPETGTYNLLVWNPEGEMGKYVLDTGTKEVFGPADLLRFPVWWYNTRAYFGQAPGILTGLGLALLGLVGVVLIRRRGSA